MTWLNLSLTLLYLVGRIENVKRIKFFFYYYISIREDEKVKKKKNLRVDILLLLLLLLTKVDGSKSEGNLDISFPYIFSPFIFSLIWRAEKTCTCRPKEINSLNPNTL